MNHDRFNAIVNRRFEECEAVLASKDEEYSSETDRLHNFYVAARMQGCSPPKALQGMLVKHIVSVWDMIDRMDRDPVYVPDRALIKDKIGDVINYMVLLEGLMDDRARMLETPIISEVSND